jgi:hypothetical protein
VVNSGREMTRAFRVLLAGLVSVLPLAAKTMAQTPRSEVEQILVPLRAGEVAGAYGSHWVTEILVRNDAEVPVRIFRFIRVTAPCPPCRGSVTRELPDLPISPKTTVSIASVVTGGDPRVFGDFFYVEKAARSKVFFSVHVRDTSRSASSAGFEVPVVSETASRMRVQLLDIPVDRRYRHTLRVYVFDYLSDPGINPANRIRIYDLETDALLVDEPLVFNGYTDQGPTSYTVEPYPNLFTYFLDAYPSLRQGSKVRVEIESNFYRFWAFSTTINNETQEATLRSPW